MKHLQAFYDSLTNSPINTNRKFRTTLQATCNYS